MMPHVLGPFHPKLRDYAKKSLDKRDVDLASRPPCKEVREDGVLVEHNGEQEFLPAGIVVWAVGVTAHPTVADWGVPQGRGGRIETDEHLRVKGMSDVFAIGDVSVGPDEPLPQLAQPAIQGGKYVAKLIKAELKGKTGKPFKYMDKGTMATIGRASAVAEIKFLPQPHRLPRLGHLGRPARRDPARQPQPVRHDDQPHGEVPHQGQPQRDRGGDPYVTAARPFVVEARRAPRTSARQSRAANAEALASRGSEGLRQDRDEG